LSEKGSGFWKGGSHLLSASQQFGTENSDATPLSIVLRTWVSQASREEICPTEFCAEKTEEIEQAVTRGAGNYSFVMVPGTQFDEALRCAGRTM